MGPQVEALVDRSEDTQLLIIDIDTWNSAVSRQYNIRRLPSVWLYDGKELVSKDTKTVWKKLQE